MAWHLIKMIIVMLHLVVGLVKKPLNQRKDMSNCCQDTPILYGNTQRRMRGVFPCNFGWGTRFRAQNEDFVHF